MNTKQETKLCEHCKTEINIKASKCPHCGGKNYVWTTGKKLLALLIIPFVFVISTSIGNSSSTSTPEPVVQKTQAEIDAWNKSPAGKLCAKYPTWAENDCQRLVDGKIWVGMTYEMLVYTNGKPDVTNPSSYGSGIRYQYCWRKYTPSCFYDNNNDGVIDSFN